ncbi:hypothetical protein [Paenisporosarcina indica]|uniref:hypothetical protein n=1 Tax=Paenisporosarcina indica TaxID=650093 RepID=UPI00094F73A0|nr:hypothetical protein [Paenisporosarcina indica]
MKEQMFGLKKEPINQMLHKMESDFLYEKIAIEIQLKSLIEENNKLRTQLKAIPKRSSIAFEDESLWQFGKERIHKMTDYLQQQKECEMADLRKDSSERIKVIQLQITEIESEIKLTEQMFSKMFQQITSLVEQSEKMDTNEKSKEVIEQVPTQFSNKNYEPSSYKNQEMNIFKKNNLTASIDKQLDPTDLSTNNEYEQNSVVSENNETFNESEDSLMVQINAIKSQYIVGKVAGEDLFDQEGHLIIAKSKVINRQVVNTAHSEGKLAELIVNMKIPGLGED